MFNTNSSYSLADIAAATGSKGNNGGWGDDSWWIILIFLFAMNGWGGNGFGGGNGRGTNAEIAYSFDMNGLENGVRGIQQGLCDGFYAVNTGMLNGFAGVQSTLCQGFSGVDSAISNGNANIVQTINATGNALTAGLTSLGSQMSQCCCDTRYDLAKGFADLGYALATQSCETRRAVVDSSRDIIDNANANTRAILDFLTQDKIATLTAENQSLKFAASQSAQNAFITANQAAQTAEIIRRLETPCPVPAYVVSAPWETTKCCGSCTF